MDVVRAIEQVDPVVSLHEPTILSIECGEVVRLHTSLFHILRIQACRHVQAASMAYSIPTLYLCCFEYSSGCECEAPVARVECNDCLLHLIMGDLRSSFLVASGRLHGDGSSLNTYLIAAVPSQIKHVLVYQQVIIMSGDLSDIKVHYPLLQCTA